MCISVCFINLELMLEPAGVVPAFQIGRDPRLPILHRSLALAFAGEQPLLEAQQLRSCKNSLSFRPGSFVPSTAFNLGWHAASTF